MEKTLQTFFFHMILKPILKKNRETEIGDFF